MAFAMCFPFRENPRNSILSLYQQKENNKIMRKVKDLIMVNNILPKDFLKALEGKKELDETSEYVLSFEKNDIERSILIDNIEQFAEKYYKIFIKYSGKHWFLENINK